jgi:hypothetical protein
MLQYNNINGKIRDTDDGQWGRSVSRIIILYHRLLCCACTEPPPLFPSPLHYRSQHSTVQGWWVENWKIRVEDTIRQRDRTALLSHGCIMIAYSSLEQIRWSDTSLDPAWKKEAKLSLCVTEHYAMKTSARRWSIDPRFLDFSTSWWWVVSFMPLPLYHRKIKLIFLLCVWVPFQVSFSQIPSSTRKASGTVVTMTTYPSYIL